MNPFPLVASMMRRNPVTLALFVALIVFAVALGVAITAQERALRQASARAADKFDLVVGAPGSPYDLIFATVYARPSAIGLIPPEQVASLLAEPQAEIVAPVAFGDSVAGHPVLGTTAVFVRYLAGEPIQGRMFAAEHEALLGANVAMEIGDDFQPAHNDASEPEHLHTMKVVAVGRLAPTGTPWDNAVIVPVEQVWAVHDLPNGHGPAHAVEAHEHNGHEHELNHAVEDIGPPFDPAFLPGVPAVVVKPANVPAAYGLRAKYRATATQALFPAEVLVHLYGIMGDARAVLGLIALATQVLIIGAILCGVMVILQLYRQRLAVLRALGATRSYIFALGWTYVTAVIATGAMLGLALGFALSQLIAAYLHATTGIAITVTLGSDEAILVATLIGLGALLALIPAALIYRQPVVEALR